jgi:hypothetical protein
MPGHFDSTSLISSISAASSGTVGSSPGHRKEAMTEVLELLGLKEAANSVELFRTWHT